MTQKPAGGRRSALPFDQRQPGSRTSFLLSGRGARGQALIAVTSTYEDEVTITEVPARLCVA